MPPFIASIIFWTGIAGLFYLDRDKNVRISKAFWIPAIYLFLISSRGPSAWLGMAPVGDPNDPSAALVEGSPIDRDVFTVLLAAILVVLIARSNKVGPLLRQNGAVLLFFLFCAVSIIWSPFEFVAFKRWSKALGDLGIVLVILSESDPLSTLKRLLTGLGFLLFPLSVLYIKYYPEIGRRLTKSWTVEPVGVAMQKNELGLSCMLYGVFFLWMFIAAYRERTGSAQRRRRLLAYGTIIAMIAWLLSQCNSMTSIIGLISAGLVTWVASRPRRSTAFVHVMVVIVLGVAVTALFFNPGGGMVEALGKDPTLTGRKDTWALLLGLHTNPWIGTGFESFWLGPRLKTLRDTLDGFPINEAHNGYLEVYLNLGWAGVSFIALFILMAYKRIIAAIRRDPENASVFLGFLLCTLFYSFTEAAFRFLSPAWLFLLLVIVAGSHATLFGSDLPARAVRTGEIATSVQPEYAVQGTHSLAH